ncbi:hypothetical protein CDD83_9440 [Cordyceps sp. RAO-2017]|nr:hypothetical protein CDD83_9440 [Cordyceps sp. RAO-2017]
MKEVEAAAKAAFSGWGISADVTAEMKKGMEALARSSTIEISKISLGELKHRSDDVPMAQGNAIATILTNLKREADEFSNLALKHDSKLYAVIDDYHTAEGFYKQQNFTPLDYSTAVRQSRRVLDRFMEIKRIEEKIRSTPVSHFMGGGSERHTLQQRLDNMVEEIHAWIADVERDPAKARALPKGDPWAFGDELKSHVKEPGRRMFLYNNGGKFYYFDQLHTERKRHALWKVEVFESHEPGTVKLVCGENQYWAIRQDSGRAVCRMDEDLPAGYSAWFEAWVYPRPVGGVTSGGSAQIARTAFDNESRYRGHNHLGRPDLLGQDFLVFYPLSAARLREDVCTSPRCERYGR